jgi:hypothetical protein
MLQTEERIREAHSKASSELENWSGDTGDFFCLTFFGEEGFRGVLVLRAPSLDAALSLSWLRNLNPGGDASSAQMPSTPHTDVLLSHSGRLLNQQEADGLYAELVTTGNAISFKR